MIRPTLKTLFVYSIKFQTGVGFDTFGKYNDRTNRRGQQKCVQCIIVNGVLSFTTTRILSFSCLVSKHL